MRISMWSGFLFGMEMDEAIRTFGKEGWHELELSAEHAAELLERGAPEKIGAEFRKFAAGEGVCFPQGHLLMKLPLGSLDRGEREAAVETLRSWCELFIAVGVKAGVLHVGGPEDMERQAGDEALFEARRESIETILEFVAGSDLAICLENTGLPDARTAPELLRLIAELPEESVGICLDTGHLVIHASEEERDNAAFVRQAGRFLKALHIADNLGHEDDHLFPLTKKNLIDWASVMQALRETGYGGLFNFETPGESVHVPISLRLHKLEYARRLAEYLESL